MEASNIGEVKLSRFRSYSFIIGCSKGAPSRRYGLESDDTRLHPLSDPEFYYNFLFIAAD
jgi:hypothetical protein